MGRITLNIIDFQDGPKKFVFDSSPNDYAFANPCNTIKGCFLTRTLPRKLGRKLGLVAAWPNGVLMKGGRMLFWIVQNQPPFYIIFCSFPSMTLRP